MGQVLLARASGSSLLGPTSPQRALQKLQVMFSASVSLFKQNALIFLVLRSCRMPLPLQPAGSHRFIVHFFAMEETSNSQLAFYPLRHLLVIGRPHAEKVRFVIYSTLYALRTAPVIQLW